MRWTMAEIASVETTLPRQAHRILKQVSEEGTMADLSSVLYSIITCQDLYSYPANQMPG